MGTLLISKIREEQGSHARPRATTKRVGDLESLEAVARLGLLSNHVQDGVYQLGALCVVPLGPVVSSSGLPEHEVVGTEELAEGTRADRVHRSGLQVHENGARD